MKRRRSSSAGSGSDSAGGAGEAETSKRGARSGATRRGKARVVSRDVIVRKDDAESDSDASFEAEAVAAGVLKPVGDAAAAAARAAGGEPASINDEEGLTEALEDIQRELPWIETLDVVSAKPLAVADVNDDTTRETAFYGQAMAAVMEARKRLDAAGERHVRPEDYYADMLKSDEHMRRVRDKLLFEQKKMDAFEKRKKQQDAKVYAKQLQAERTKEKNKSKKEQMEAVRRWRKDKTRRGDGGGAAVDDAELEALIAGKSDAAGRGAGRGSAGRGQASWKKRAAADRKYGFGGRKKNSRSNDRKSVGDVSGFSLGKNRTPFPAHAKMAAEGGRGRGGAARGGRGRGRATNRPGKARRAQSRGSRR